MFVRSSIFYFIILNSLQIGFSQSNNLKCTTSRPFQASLSVQSYLMSHGKLGTVPKIGLQISTSNGCTLNEYITNFGVRYVDIPQHVLPISPSFTPSQELTSVLKAINDFLSIKNDLFFIKVASKDPQVIASVEKQILDSQNASFTRLKVISKFELSSLLASGSSELELLSGGYNLILLHSGLQDIQSVQTAVAPIMYHNLPQGKDVLINSTSTNLAHLRPGCSMGGSSYNSNFSLIYAGSEPNNTALQAANLCGLTIIYDSPEKVTKGIETIFLFVVFRRSFDNAVKDCFFAQKEQVDSQNILVLRNYENCGAGGAKRRVLCRDLTNPNSIYLGARTNAFLGASSGSFCRNGYATIPATNAEAHVTFELLQKENVTNDEGIWLNLAISTVSSSQIVWTAPIPLGAGPVATHHLWKLLLLLAAIAAIVGFLLFKRARGKSYESLNTSKVKELKKEGEMREVKLQFDDSESDRSVAI